MASVPYHTRRVVCSYCGRLMQDGTGEAYFGCCVPCGDRINRQQERDRRRRAREAWAYMTNPNPPAAREMTAEEEERMWADLAKGE